MIHPSVSRVCVLCLLIVGIGVLGGCMAGRSEAVVRSTPASPIWKAAEARDVLRSLRSAASVLERSASTPSAESQARRVADYLSAQMRRYGVQPGAEAHRLHYLRSDGALGAVAMPLMVGLVAGRDPLARGAVIVYAPLDAARAAVGQPLRAATALELARVLAELGETYRFPARTVIFVLPVGSDHAAALRSYGQQPIWPLEYVEAVLTIGVPEADRVAWQKAGLSADANVYNLDPTQGASLSDAAPEEQVIALARQGYAWLLPQIGVPPPQARVRPREGQ